MFCLYGSRHRHVVACPGVVYEATADSCRIYLSVHHELCHEELLSIFAVLFRSYDEFGILDAD